jgi:DNA invertase Pin-like site-specific DNA recombinase
MKGEKTMKYIGYHRTSTKEQHLDRGLAEIKAYCEQNNIPLKKIYTDQQTGKNFDRPRYTVMKEDVLEAGDVLIITELDRLGRSKKDTMREIQHYRDSGIRLMVLELPTTLMDLSKMDNSLQAMMLETINNMMLELYASMAQAEIEKKEKRQREGIEAKKKRGEWEDYGRPSIEKPDNWDAVIAQWEGKEITAVEAMKRLGLKKTSFYKLVKADKATA